VNPKPRALAWLESETGQTIPYEPSKTTGNDRHLSVRLPAPDADRLEQMAADRGMNLSQLVRAILASALADHGELADLAGPDLAARLAADLAEVQRRLAS
jgi:hypothetical protein